MLLNYSAKLRCNANHNECNSCIDFSAAASVLICAKFDVHVFINLTLPSGFSSLDSASSYAKMSVANTATGIYSVL